MCGCLGKYTTNPAYQEQVGKMRGYSVSDDECSERSVKIMANKILNHPNVVMDDGLEFAYVEDRLNNTMKVVYFNKNVNG
jgi:hypothetical protein